MKAPPYSQRAQVQLAETFADFKTQDVEVIMEPLKEFAGLAWAGIMGLFYGPIIMLMLATTVQVYVEVFAE